MAAEPHILVVGAGIGGLTAALALMRRGLRVDVFDQVPEMKELGAGIQIAPNGSRVLRELGLGETLERVAIEANIIDLRIWDTGARSKMMEATAPRRSSATARRTTPSTAPICRKRFWARC